MPLLKVYSTNGQARREIAVPGRSAMRPYGAVQIVNNAGDRQESDWLAVKAALAAGNVVICLSNYETDVLPLHLEGNLPYGGNVRFESKKLAAWKLVEEDSYCHFEISPFACVHCGVAYPNAFLLGGHVQREHREAAQRAQAAATA